MAYGLDIVTVGIEHEGRVVVLVVVRAQARRTVVSRSGRNSRTMEFGYRSAILGNNGDVQDAAQSAFATDPEIRLSVGAEAGRRRFAFRVLGPDLHHQRVAERRQRFAVERF